jgi:hypothetical protein
MPDQPAIDGARRMAAWLYDAVSLFKVGPRLVFAEG